MGENKMPAKVWLRVCGGGTRFPGHQSYVTVTGDSIVTEGRTVYHRSDLVEQMAAGLNEGFQILGNLIDSIQRHGNYSPESTITFVDQARQCVRSAILRARQAADTEGAK